MKFQIVIISAALLSACAASGDETAASDVTYKVQPGYWTGKSVTEYSATKDAIEPYVHDWCLGPNDVTIAGSELSEALAGFVADGRGVCTVSHMDAKPYILKFGLSCILDDVDMTGQGLMSYAEDGKTTDMLLTVKSDEGEPPVAFSRTAHQEIKSDTCPPEDPSN